jgi:hypothetical protein
MLLPILLYNRCDFQTFSLFNIGDSMRKMFS